MELFKNEHFFLTRDFNNDIYISVTEKDFDIKKFNNIIAMYPRVVVNKVIQLRRSLVEATGEEVKIGYLNDRIEVFISSDKMKAEIKLNITEVEYSDQWVQIISEIMTSLEKAGVKEGVLFERLKTKLPLKQKVVIAEGIEPINGVDANVQYLKIPERKPVIRDDGKANFYDLQFIAQVKQTDWLGEKELPGLGTPGRTVTGEDIPPKKGKDLPIRYDKKTVEAVQEKGKIILRALINGAVEFSRGAINVQKHVVIKGDVDTSTGNIDFDGSVTINGIVKDGFSVVATNDICILGDIGVGKIKKIYAKEGDIYIKGGVSGGTEAVLEAGENIFVKYANDCTLIAGNTINIGLYSFGSTLQAKNIILDNPKGRIVGGLAQAELKVVSGVIGNSAGRETIINVVGFDRTSIMTELNNLLIKYKTLLMESDQIKRMIDVFKNVGAPLSMKDKQEQGFFLGKYDKTMKEIYELEQKRKLLLDYLKTKGDGQISVSQKAYPPTMLQIKVVQKKLEQITTGTFYAIGNELHFE